MKLEEMYVALDTHFCHPASPMNKSNEDPSALVCLIEQNEALYDDCYRVAVRSLERHPPSDNIEQGVGNATETARADLADTLKTLVHFSDAEAIREHLRQARIDWRELAAAVIVDVLVGVQETRSN